MSEPTTFDDVDVDRDVDQDGKAPAGDSLTTGEDDAIESQVTEIVTGNAGRGPGEQISVDPAEVN